MKRPELDPNAQKTHYLINPRDRKKAKLFNDLPSTLAFEESNRTPFCKLLDEKSEHILHRFDLYEQIWGRQLNSIQRILNTANNELFENLLLFIKDPVSPKLNVAFLGLSSNTANNFRVLDDFSSYLMARPSQSQNFRMVTLNSKVCFNVKTAMREVVKQVLKGHSRRNEKSEYLDEEDEEQDSTKEHVKLENADEDAIEAENEDDFDGDGGRISYDFEIVEDWIKDYTKNPKNNENFRIVVIFEDTNGFSNEVLNQLVQLFCVYATRAPIKLILSLSSKNVSDWITSNITSNLRTLISGCKLEAKENKDIGFQVINDILLQNEITAENPLLLDDRLSLIVLNRFENSNNSIDSLISELKLSYMIHFYQLPLSALVDPNFTPEAFHYAAIRKLPSFKTYIEFQMHKLGENTPGSSEFDSIQSKIIGYLHDDKKLHELLDSAKKRLQSYQNAVMNCVRIVHRMGQFSRRKFQIYKLITNNQLINSVYLSDMLKKAKQFSRDETYDIISFIHGDEIKESVGECVDEDIVNLRKILTHDKIGETVEVFTKYLHSNKNVNMKINDNLFNEILTINGGISEFEKLGSSTAIEENYENLMINLIRPKLRELIENGLDIPQRYLRNSLILQKMGQTNKSSRLTGPVLSKLYQVYKDAPVNINLWDFYLAFKLSLQRKELLLEIATSIEKLDKETCSNFDRIAKSAESNDAEWDKLVYAWFLQSCFELEAMGFLREKSKGDYVEKLIWKNL